MIPYGRQSVSQEDIDAVIKVLKSDFLTQGPVTPEFEKAICSYTGATYGVAVSSGTAALHVACLALGLGKGDVLWTVPNTFVASANCGIYCGAQIDFVDISEYSWNIDVEKLKEKLEVASLSGKLPKVLVVVHFSGLPADMAEISELALKYDFHIIEDACHALGASYRTSHVGSCSYSDITVFSFHPVKSITTAEGGIAVTHNEEFANRMRLLASHGITRNQSMMMNESEGEWYYQQIELGFNYRLSDIHAGLGLSQLMKLDQFIETRQQIAREYDEAFSGLPVDVIPAYEDRKSAYHLYPIVLKGECAVSRSELYQRLREQGIGINVHYIPVHMQPYYRSNGFIEGDFPVAENYYRQAVSLPCFPELTTTQQRKVISLVQKYLK